MRSRSAIAQRGRDRAAALAAVVRARWSRSPNRRWKPIATGASDSYRNATGVRTSNGSKTSAIGTSRARCGGDISLPVWYTPGRRRRSWRKPKKKRCEIAQRDHGTRELSARSRHARHVVLERLVAVLDFGLAREDARTRVLVSVPSPDHGLGDHLSLGRAHGDARHALSSASIPFPTVFITPLVFDAQGRKMSKSLGQRDRPDGSDRKVRRRRVSHWR